MDPLNESIKPNTSALFASEYPRLHRFLHRLSGESETASDLAQEAFARLHQRGESPDAPRAWLVTVALNLFRNLRSAQRRQRELLTDDRAERSMGDAPPAPDANDDARDVRAKVRAALDSMSERDRGLLLLHSEGYRYREIATALSLNEASVGTLLARARRAFKARYEGRPDAP